MKKQKTILMNEKKLYKEFLEAKKTFRKLNNEINYFEKCMKEKNIFKQCVFCKVFKSKENISYWYHSKSGFNGYVCFDEKCFKKIKEIINGENDEKNNYKDS